MMENFPKVDLTYYIEVGGGDDDFVKEAIETFIEHIPLSISEIKGIVEGGELTSAAHLIHKIKPSYAMLDIPIILLEKLETSLKSDNNKEGVMKELNDLEDLTNNVIAQLQLLIKKYN